MIWLAVAVAWGGGIAGAVYLGMHDHPVLGFLVAAMALATSARTRTGST